MSPLHRTALAAAETRVRRANDELLRVIRAKAERRATQADLERAHAARTEAEGELFGVIERIEADQTDELAVLTITIPGRVQTEKIRAAAAHAPVHLVK